MEHVMSPKQYYQSTTILKGRAAVKPGADLWLCKLDLSSGIVGFGFSTQTI